MRGIPALVNVKWLVEQLTQRVTNICIVDASWHLPSSQRDAKYEYREKHIPGAVFFDIDACSNKNSHLSHMLPDTTTFEDYVGKLGIDNKTLVVVYDNSTQYAVFSSPRVWWTFRVFGHGNVTILDGGLPMWCRENQKVEAVYPMILRKRFFANYQPQLVKSYRDVLVNIKKKKYQVLDARSAGRFNGIDPEPREGIKPGHIRGSLNTPFMDITDENTKLVKSPAKLHSWLTGCGVDLGTNSIASCGTGVTACSIALAAYICGRHDVAIYDGSWTDWYERADPKNMAAVPGRCPT